MLALDDDDGGLFLVETEPQPVVSSDYNALAPIVAAFAQRVRRRDVLQHKARAGVDAERFDLAFRRIAAEDGADGEGVFAAGIGELHLAAAHLAPELRGDALGRKTGGKHGTYHHAKNTREIRDVPQNRVAAK